MKHLTWLLKNKVNQWSSRQLIWKSSKTIQEYLKINTPTITTVEVINHTYDIFVSGIRPILLKETLHINPSLVDKAIGSSSVSDVFGISTPIINSLSLLTTIAYKDCSSSSEMSIELPVVNSSTITTVIQYVATDIIDTGLIITTPIINSANITTVINYITNTSNEAFLIKIPTIKEMSLI